MDNIKTKGNSFESKEIKSPYTLRGSTSIGQTFLEDRSPTRNICYKQKPSNLNKSFLPSASSNYKKNNFSSVPKGIKHLKSNMCNHYKKTSKKKQKNRNIKSGNQYTGNDTHSKYQENFLPYTSDSKTGSFDQTFTKTSRHKKKKKKKGNDLHIVKYPKHNVLENSAKNSTQVKDCNSKLIPEEERHDNELFFFDVSGNIRNTLMHKNTEYNTFRNESKNGGPKKKNKKKSFGNRESGTATIEKAIIKNSSDDSNQNRPSGAKANKVSNYCGPKSKNTPKESDLGISPSMNSKTTKLHKWEKMLIDIRDSDCEVTSFHESVSKKKKKKENKIHESEVENDTEVESIRKSRDRRNNSDKLIDSYCEQLNVNDHSMPKVKKKQHEVSLDSNNLLSKDTSLNSNIKINKTKLKPNSEKQNDEMASYIKGCDFTAENLSPVLKGKNKKSAHTDKLLDILRKSNRYNNNDIISTNENNSLRKLNTMLLEIVKDSDCEVVDVNNSSSSSKKKQENTKRGSLSLNAEHTVKTNGKTLKNDDNFVIIKDSDNEIMSKSQKKKKKTNVVRHTNNSLLLNKSLGQQENIETTLDTDSKKKHDSSKDDIFDYLKLLSKCSDNDDQVIADAFNDEDNIVSVTNSSFKKKKKRKPNTNESADTNRTLSKSEFNKSLESVLFVDSFEDKLNNVDNTNKDDEKIRINDVNSSLFKKERRRSQRNKSFETDTVCALKANHEMASKNYRDINNGEIIIEDAVQEDIGVVSINDSSTFISEKKKKKKKRKPIENDSVHTNIESAPNMEHGTLESSSTKDDLAGDSYLFTKKRKRKKQRENEDVDGNDIKAVATNDSSIQSKKGNKHLQANAADEITEKTPNKEHEPLTKDVTFIDSSTENFVELNSIKKEADNFDDISSLRKKKKKKRQENESSDVNTSKMHSQISFNNDLEDVNFVEAEKPHKFKKEKIDSVDVVSNFNNENYDNEIFMLNHSDFSLSKKKKKNQKENELFEASIESTSDRKSPTSEGNDFESISRCKDNYNYSEIVIVKGDEDIKPVIIDDSVVKIKKEKQIEADLVDISSGNRLKKKHKKDSESVTFVDSLEEDFYKSIKTEAEVVVLSDASSPLKKKKKKKKHQEYESFEVKSENTSKKRRQTSIGSDLEGINGRNDEHIDSADDQDDGDETVNTSSFSIKNKKKNKQTEDFSVDIITKDKPKKKSGAVPEDVIFIDNFEENLDTITNKVNDGEVVAQVDSGSASKKRKKRRVSESCEENIEGTFKRKRQYSVGVHLEDVNEKEILITDDKDEATNRFTINEPSVENKRKSKHNESQVLVVDDQRDSVKNASVSESPVKTERINKRTRSASVDITTEENWKKHETNSEDATSVGSLEEHIGDFKNKIHDDERVWLRKGSSLSEKMIHQENESESDTELKIDIKYEDIDYSFSTKNKKKNEETRNEKNANNTPLPEKKSKKWKVEDYLLDQGNTSNAECELNEMTNEQSFSSEDIIIDSDSDGISDFALFKIRKKERSLENLFETLNTKNNSYVGEVYVSSSEGYKSDSSEILSPEKQLKKQKQSGDNYKNDSNRNISCTAAPHKNILRKKKRGRKPKKKGVEIKENGNESVENRSAHLESLKGDVKVNSNDKSGILRGVPLVDCSKEATEDDIEKFKNTIVMLPFTVPPLHSILTRSTFPPKSQIDEIKDRNIEVKTGQFSQEEDDKIIANWKEFCKEHQLPMIPSMFVSLPRKMPMAEKTNFLRYLAHGLDNRMFHRVHARFKVIAEKPVKKEGRFTPEEDKVILKYVKKNRSYRINRELAEILNRPTLSIEKRLYRLYAINKSTITWGRRLIDKLVRRMMKITKCKDVAELEHRTLTPKEWRKISKMMNDIPVLKLQQAWELSVYPRLFANADVDLRKIKYKTIEILHKKNVTDWKGVTWTKIAQHFQGFTPIKLYMMFKQLVLSHVPKEMQDSLKECIDFLKTKFTSYKKLPTTHPFKPLLFKNGHIRRKRLPN